MSAGTCLSPTIHRSVRGRTGSVPWRVCDDMSWHFIAQENATRGNLNTVPYQVEILRPVAIPIQQNRGMILMHDGATCHTAQTTRTLLQQQ
jgi:hypothetical protein